MGNRTICKSHMKGFKKGNMTLLPLVLNLSHMMKKKPWSKREPRIRATTIDDFLKENGIDLENVLASLDLPVDGPSTKPSYDGNDSSALHADYYNQVMADIDDKQGTLGRNKRFVRLAYTNWLVVPQGAKDFMWNYVNRFKGKVKRSHFVPYDNIEDMVKNRPLQAKYGTKVAKKSERNEEITKKSLEASSAAYAYAP
ncbi:hypothetical protein PIB30_093008 [Stylosanthes scabra]|uniref:Uncharacterized protein n=1 Tax=Stylosanthes scabra TaxID=79078 RepID=A0ABU6QVR6_9FABA|nr:hypothetical protein [Stylosanthes scabra]